MLLKSSSNGVELLSVNVNKLKKTLQRITGRIKREHAEVKKILLFGSFSKNNYTPYSDIDIAIILDKTKKGFMKRADDYLDYFLDVPFDVNIVVYTSQEFQTMIENDNKFALEILQGITL